MIALIRVGSYEFVYLFDYTLELCIFCSIIASAAHGTLKSSLQILDYFPDLILKSQPYMWASYFISLNFFFWEEDPLYIISGLFLYINAVVIITIMNSKKMIYSGIVEDEELS